MIEENAYKYVAPAIDRLLDRFERGFLNPSVPTKELLSSLVPLFDAVKDLKPYKDGEAKSLWVIVPRGDISDYGDYEEWKEYGDVSSYEEFESLWREEYPRENVWYKLFLSDGKDYRYAALNNKAFVNARLDESPVEFSHYADEAKLLCDLLLEPVKRSMDLLYAGKYNSLVASSLPFHLRTGAVKRNIVWDAEPQMKENIFENLPEETYLTFRNLIEFGANDETRIGRIKTFTGNDFLKACSIGYKACSYEGEDLPLVEQYLLHADGRDEGLTGKGYGLEKGPGIDLDDPAAWDKWYFDRKRSGGHPWEVCRGGNSTHIDLYVCNDRDHIHWMLARKEISEKQARDMEEKAGYYFCVAGDAWNRSVEAVKFYVALKKANLPVVLQNADAILSRFKGEDYIGIVPHTTFPAYCESMFPERFGIILDFMHVYQEDMDRYGDHIEWLPEQKASLIS